MSDMPCTLTSSSSKKLSSESNSAESAPSNLREIVAKLTNSRYFKFPPIKSKSVFNKKKLVPFPKSRKFSLMLETIPENFTYSSNSSTSKFPGNTTSSCSISTAAGKSVHNSNSISNNKIDDLSMLLEFKTLSIKENKFKSVKNTQAISKKVQIKSRSSQCNAKSCTLHANSKQLQPDLSSESILSIPNLNSLSLSENVSTCTEQARTYEDTSTDELAAYFDTYLHFPKKMSYMAEMMYT